MRSKSPITLLLAFSLLCWLAGCRPAVSESTSNRLPIVATTTLVGDVVAQVGGEHIDLQVLLPPGTDPHSFEPTPQDLSVVAEARLVFANGLGLEAFLEALIDNAGGQAEMILASEGISSLEAPGEAGHATEEDKTHASKGQDPHVWTDPNQVKVWVANIERALSTHDPSNAAIYQANAQRYLEQLADLDTWIRSQVEQVPPQNRAIVTDHQIFGYFARAYGFEQVGAIIPGYSTMAEPTAQELAKLEDTITSLGVKAIFVGDTVNPNLAQRVAEDTQTQLVTVLTGSLTPPDGPAPSYLDYMRYNVNAIISALK